MTSITRKPMELHRGDTITVDPDPEHGGRRVQWTVVSRNYTTGGEVTITCLDEDDLHLVLHVDPVAELTVRPEPRMAVVHGLRQAATFLETHPDVPLREFEHVRVQHSVDCFTDGLEAQRAEVDRIAEVMGEKPGEVYGGPHYGVIKVFGPVIYIAVSSQNDDATAEGDTR